LDWNLPRIDQDIFSVHAFQSVIQAASDGTGWVWIDVACIDQRNDSELKSRRCFSLAELEAELDIALNQKSPMLAQLFVHLRPAPIGQA
jgi:hypothetical protein